MTDVVFLHGWLMGTDLWDAQVDALRGKAKCHAVKQPGHGAPGLGAGKTMADWADHLAAHLDSLGADQAVLVGHSMGGMLVQETFRRHHDRVEKLVLVSTTDKKWPAEQQEQFQGLAAMCVNAWGPELAGTVANLLISGPFLDAHPGWVESFEKRVRSEFDLQAIADLAFAIATHDDLVPVANSIDVPAMVIHGTADQAIPIAEGESLAADIPGAHFIEIEGSGHAPSIENPREVSAALVEFISD